MRRIILGTVLVLAAFTATACQPPAPTVGMTATAEPANPACGSTGQIKGDIDETATSSVVLQRTVGGKWQDWKWIQTFDSDELPHLIKATPAVSGKFSMSYRIPSSRATLHLRVRSAGGSVVSNGVYVNPTGC